MTGAKDGLPSLLHAARGREHVVPTVALVQFGTLERRVGRSLCRRDQRIAVNDNAPGIRDARAVGGQAIEVQHIGEPGATSRERVDQVDAAVLVPQWAGIDQTLAGFYQHGLRPGAARVGCGRQVDTVIGIGIVDPILTGVMSNRRRPDAGAVFGDGERILGHEARQRVIHQGPVHEITRVQDRQAGHRAETRRDHVVVLAHPDRIGIGVVRVEDGVPEGAVTGVGNPWRDR